MLLLKLIGIVLIAIGFWLLKSFPGLLEHQKPGFSISGIFIGLLFLLFGAILLLVG